ncbi:unnamed protein product [Caenorhabditis auriculariae]|uniref:Uncharacterized protein n=1 Tax=Caenorhabditis auriculariae TaxID=2777116 RepID=A0A8S1H397_9PELO|nr:unnamed protein product [Caenorhabditis auriculariae]
MRVRRNCVGTLTRTHTHTRCRLGLGHSCTIFDDNDDDDGRRHPALCPSPLIAILISTHGDRETKEEEGKKTDKMRKHAHAGMALALTCLFSRYFEPNLLSRECINIWERHFLRTMILIFHPNKRKLSCDSLKKYPIISGRSSFPLSSETKSDPGQAGRRTVQAVISKIVYYYNKKGGMLYAPSTLDQRQKNPSIIP